MLSFKTWMENSSALPVALVGWTGTTKDKILLHKVEGQVQHDPYLKKLWPHARFDKINLNHGRDFLEETKEYEVVVLCWVHADDKHAGQKGEYNVSKHHKPINWKQRLINTKARFIFATGAATEVSGQYLGQIPGYKATQLDQHMTVYIHENLYR